MIEYRDATLKDVLELSKTMRKGDVEEIQASNGITPYEALLMGFKVSKATVATADGEVIAMFGVASGAEGIGTPWLLGSDLMATMKKELLEHPVKWLKEVNEKYPILINYVDARNKVAIRWLKHLGFTFVQRIPEYGNARIPFYEFVRIKTHV